MAAQHGNANPIVGLMVGGAFVAFGLALFFLWGKPTLEKAEASKNWPKVSGVIKSSTVNQSTDKDRNTSYTPNVVFEYALNGRKFTSSTIAVGSGWSSNRSSIAYQVTNKYPVGDIVEVAYDPEEPSFAVLETGAIWTTHIIYYFGLVFAGFGVLISGYPLVQLIFLAFFVGSSLTSSAKPTSTSDPRFPEGNPSTANTGTLPSQSLEEPELIGSTSASDIGEGITIQ